MLGGRLVMTVVCMKQSTLVSCRVTTVSGLA